MADFSKAISSYEFINKQKFLLRTDVERIKLRNPKLANLSC
jgi:hypothetical protein